MEEAQRLRASKITRSIGQVHKFQMQSGGFTHKGYDWFSEPQLVRKRV